MLLSLIPAVRPHSKLKISNEFSDWMVQIRDASRHLDQIAIGHASSAPASTMRNSVLASARLKSRNRLHFFFKFYFLIYINKNLNISIYIYF